MKFKQAQDELKKITGDEYRTLCYTLTIHSDGTEKANCAVYAHGLFLHEADTWGGALALLKEQAHPTKPTAPDETEAPQIDA